MRELLIVLKITCMWLLSASKNIVPIKSYDTFKSSKFATLPQDYPSLIVLVSVIQDMKNRCENLNLQKNKERKIPFSLRSVNRQLIHMSIWNQ